jgi:hypothetical protein
LAVVGGGVGGCWDLRFGSSRGSRLVQLPVNPHRSSRSPSYPCRKPNTQTPPPRTQARLPLPAQNPPRSHPPPPPQNPQAWSTPTPPSATPAAATWRSTSTPSTSGPRARRLCQGGRTTEQGGRTTELAARGRKSMGARAPPPRAPPPPALLLVGPFAVRFGAASGLVPSHAFASAATLSRPLLAGLACRHSGVNVPGPRSPGNGRNWPSSRARFYCRVRLWKV